jgi:hypothetical protein
MADILQNIVKDYKQRVAEIAVRAAFFLLTYDAAG